MNVKATERRLRATVRNMQQLAIYKAVDFERLDSRLIPVVKDKIDKCEATIANTKVKLRGIGNVHNVSIPQYDMS
jgi:hypothetical protein